MTTTTLLTADELLKAAADYYGENSEQMFVDVAQQVVHPSTTDRGCSAVKIDANGNWAEVWYTP